MPDDTCPCCGGPTDPSWYCSEGFCPACCEAADEEDEPMSVEWRHR